MFSSVFFCVHDWCISCIIMSIYTSYTCYYIFTIKCFQYFVRSNVNDKHRVVNKLMWLHFFHLYLSLSLFQNICTKQLMIVCILYTIHFTTLHHYYTYLSSLSKLCFPRIIFFFFSGFVHSLHSLEVFSVQLLIIKLIESMHCFLWFNWDAMQWPQFPFVLNIIFGLI